MKFAFIDADKARWPVEVQCDLFGVLKPPARSAGATTAARAYITNCVSKVAESVGSGLHG